MNTNDDDLKSLFGSLRSVDERGVPDLTALIARPRARRRRPIVLIATLAAAAIILVVAGRQVVSHAARGDIARTPTASIVTWESPTASLLKYPGQELLRTVPTLKSSLLRNPRYPGA